MLRVILLALALLAGCGKEEPAPPPDFDPARLQAQPACRSQQYEGAAYTVCPFDARKDSLRLVWRDADGRALRSLTALEQSLGADAERVRFAMNAGMFDEQGAPIGLFVADGVEGSRLNRNKGAGNFHLMPNGVFAVARNGALSVMPSDDFAALGVQPALATQSGPMLVVGGKLHPAFEEDGESRLVRNGVGVRDARTAYFVISDDAVSFGRFARFFRDGLNCANALYLDGSVSSLWDPAAGQQDAYDQLGPMLVALKRAPSAAK